MPMNSSGFMAPMWIERLNSDLDLDAPIELWTPMVGQRVRLLGTTECHVATGHVEGSAGIIHGETNTEGFTGTIVAINPCFWHYCDECPHGHPYQVDWDKKFHVWGPVAKAYWVGGVYAACEIEPL